MFTKDHLEKLEAKIIENNHNIRPLTVLNIIRTTIYLYDKLEETIDRAQKWEEIMWNADCDECDRVVEEAKRNF